MQKKEKGGVDMKVPRKMAPCHSHEAIVTVLSYCDGIMDGYLQHPRLCGKEKLHSLSQMVLLLGGLLDLEGCPGNPWPFVSPICDGPGSIAVFRIQVLFREHYTWQGKLIWQEEGQEAVFQSGIELMQLFDEILAGDSGTADGAFGSGAESGQENLGKCKMGLGR